MHTNTLQRSTIHPHTEEQRLLTFERPERLAPADRIAFRIGLWLLQRSLHRPEEAPAQTHPRPRAGITEHQAITLLIHAQQRQLF